MITTPRNWGYRPDPADERDRMHAPKPGVTRITERRMDLLVRRIHDQLSSSSCVGHGVASSIVLAYALAQRDIPDLSPMHAYWLARAQDGFQHEDAGAYIRSCIRAVRKVGCCGMTEWPLNMDLINARPPMSAEMSGIRFADLSYERVTGGSEGVLDALQAGHPVVFGTQVGYVFMDHVGDDTIPAPRPGEVMLGGHCVYAAGLDRGGERVRIVNSWGTSWADKGFAWIEREWFDLSATQDCWAIISPAEAA